MVKQEHGFYKAFRTTLCFSVLRCAPTLNLTHDWSQTNRCNATSVAQVQYSQGN